MSALQATPGPWRIVGDMTHIGNRRIASQSFTAIAKVYADEPRRDDAKAIANANLIAAAPDLYEACAWAEAALAPFSKEPTERSGINLLRGAIAKARGEQVSA